MEAENMMVFLLFSTTKYQSTFYQQSAAGIANSLT
jgi:hypothetical protein